MQMMKHKCRSLPENHTIDIDLESNLDTDAYVTSIVYEKDICNRFSLTEKAAPLYYRWWRHNPWIFPEVEEYDSDDEEYSSDDDSEYEYEYEDIKDEHADYAATHENGHARTCSKESEDRYCRSPISDVEKY